MRNLDITIAILSLGQWEGDYGLSLCSIVADFSHKIQGYDTQNLNLNKKQGSILANMREEALQDALEQGRTHVLFLDSDQTFTPDTLRRLLAWDKPVVACNIATKQFPSLPTARLRAENSEGKVLYSFKGSTGLKQVWRVGCGVMLVRLDCVKNLPEPWFYQRWRPEVRKFQGEDWGFCETLEKHGVPIYVDQALSYKIGHVGKMVYTHDLVQSPLEPSTAKRMHLLGELPPDVVLNVEEEYAEVLGKEA